MEKRLLAVAAFALTAGTLSGCVGDGPYEHGAGYYDRDRGYYEHNGRFDRRDEERREAYERREERRDDRY